MPFIDRAGALKGKDLHLELGCGGSPTPQRVVGIDQRDLPGVDVVGDVHEVLAALEDGSVEHVGSRHFFEHVDEPAALMAELGRIIKPAGTMTVVVPHWSNPYFYSDPTHSRFYGLYSFSYLVTCDLFEREVPDYGAKAPFAVARVRLVFARETRNSFLRQGKKVVGRLINGTTERQETYEAHFSRILSCYEIEFDLVRL